MSHYANRTKPQCGAGKGGVATTHRGLGVVWRGLGVVWRRVGGWVGFEGVRFVRFV